MIRLATRVSLVAFGALALGAAQSALAQTPQDRPFSMRGVELDITLPEFRQVAKFHGSRYLEMVTRNRLVAGERFHLPFWPRQQVVAVYIEEARSACFVRPGFIIGRWLCLLRILGYRPYTVRKTR